MRRTPAATLGAAIVVTALGLSACSSDVKPAPVPRPRATQDTTEVTDTTTVAPLPAPDMLANVIYRLADTSIPADQKLGLVQYATPDDQAGLENFGQALRDGGFSELTVQATDLHWSGASNNVIANVTVGSRSDTARTFTYPMEFSPIRDSWQLTRQTADLLLKLGAQVRTTPPG